MDNFFRGYFRGQNILDFSELQNYTYKGVFMDTECILYMSVSHTLANRGNEIFKIVAMREQMAKQFWELVGERLSILINQ